MLLLSSIAFTLFLLGSCTNRGGASLKRHDLFSIPLGTLSGELDWFYRDGFRMAGTADIQTLDGLVYISGGNAGKLMVFNSYGDLLTFVHDPVRNSAPSTNEDGESTRSVKSWPFRSLRTIAAFDGGFMVDDGVEKVRQMEDRESGIVYDRVVLRFNRNGDYLGHLGRDGFGGAPFPYIESIDVRKNGGTVVTSRIRNAWLSFWFDAEGRPLATVRIQENQLPDIRPGSNVAVYSVHPDPEALALHVRADIYPPDSSGSRPDARLYTLDMASLEYSEPISISYTEGNPSKDAPSIPPEYLGATNNGNHVFIAPEGADLYRLTVMDSDGRVIQNKRLIVDSDFVVYRKFRLQNSGLLTGLFLGSSEATVSWWRLDKLLGNEH